MDTSSPSPDPFHGLDPADLMAAAAMPTDGGADTIPLTARDLPSLEEIATAFPDLEVLDLIGHGGMSAVFRVRQPKLDRVVALKVLPKSLAATPGFAERFTREGRVLARLSHPSIVAVHDFGESGGFCFLIMEYVDGVNLRQAMRAGRFTPEQALNIIPAICDALQFAHTQGVLHRDIKPENILLDSKGRVKIADFGIAKIISEDAGDAMLLTQSGARLGTAPYMAPEQIEQPSSVDHRADIYSLGVVFYEMLTGELPLGRFAAPSEFAAVGGNIDEIVFRALEKERGRRQQSAGEFKTQIENLGSMPASTQRTLAKRFQSFEYKSKRTIFGRPLLHVTQGIDPTTGEKRVARGIFAFGEIAIGVFAFGGYARGWFACGGMAVGGVAIGGLSIGLLSWGGLALALLLAVGGLSIGPLATGGAALGWNAVGGIAMGWDAFGGIAIAQHGMGGKVIAPDVVLKLTDMPETLQYMAASSWWTSIGAFLWLPLMLPMMLVPWWARRQLEICEGADQAVARRASARVFWLFPALALLCAVLWWMLHRWATSGMADAAHFIIPTVIGGVGCLFLVLSLPLWLLLVPMNSFYGVRLPSTFASDERWYAVNAVFGKHLFWWALAVIAAGIAGFYQLPRHQDAYPWAAITLTLVAVAASVVATLWWMRQHPEGAPPLKKNRLASWSGQVVVAVVIAMFIKSFIAGAYKIPQGNEPGVARNSHWFASHLDTGFSIGDLIIFEHEIGQTWIARVVERQPKGLRLKRGGSPDEFFVPWDKIVGKMLFSHFSPDYTPAVPEAKTPALRSPVSEGTSKALEQKPVLRFTRLKVHLDAWRWPVYLPDGTKVENAVSQPLIAKGHQTECSNEKPDTCWWQLWFEHPDLDRKSRLSVSLTDLDGKPLGYPDRETGHAGPGWSSKESNPSLNCITLSPGRKNALPNAVRMVLTYSVGPWQQGNKVGADYHGGITFKNGGQLAGIGEDNEQHAFMSWSRQQNEWQPDVFVQLKSGTRLDSNRHLRTGSDSQLVEQFHFPARLTEVDHFQTRTRKIQTVVFDHVVVPPLPSDEGVSVDVKAGAVINGPVDWHAELTVMQAVELAGGAIRKPPEYIRVIRDGIPENISLPLARTMKTRPDDQIIIPE